MGGGGGGGSYAPQNPPTIIVPTPAALPASPDPAPTPVDPTVQAARDATKRKARSYAGYASTITSSPLGVTAPATTTAPPKALLGG